MLWPAMQLFPDYVEVFENYKIKRGHLPITVRVLILIFKHFTNPMEIIDIAI